MKILALFVLACPLWCQQWCGSASPVPLSASDLSLGSGRFGVWTIGLRAVNQSPLTISRVEILERFPELRPLPSWMTVDVLARSAYKDKRSVLARVAKVALRLAPAALSIAGLVTGTDAATYAGLGLGAATALVEGFSARTPDPVPATAHLLPDDGVTLGAQGGTWIIVSGLVSGAHTLGPRCASAIQASETGQSSLAAEMWVTAPQSEQGAASPLATAAPLATFSRERDIWEMVGN